MNTNQTNNVRTDVQHVTDHRVLGVRNETVVSVFKLCRIGGETVRIKGAFCAACADKLSGKEIGEPLIPTTRYQNEFGSTTYIR